MIATNFHIWKPGRALNKLLYLLRDAWKYRVVPQWGMKQQKPWLTSVLLSGYVGVSVSRLEEIWTLSTILQATNTEFLMKQLGEFLF